MNDTQDELRRAVDFTFRALHDAATMSDRLEHYARADGDRAAELAKQIRDLNARIDKVAKIIGERVSGLVDRLDKLDPPGFPTGGASTAEAATDAVLPVPQRGDRVRLEGTYSRIGTKIPDGWYDVVGCSTTAHPGEVNEFQVVQPVLGEAQGRLYWVAADHPGLKEVRHADHT